MAVLLYARVSTGQQAQRELSIPAQLRLMRRYAEEHGLLVAGVYQDVHSGKVLRGRSGIVSLLAQARRDKMIDGIVVHKIDRLSRNIFNYLILKTRLRSSGVRIHSVVETIDETPMGEFMEHLMAAQAEFYSANLANEVKKGMEEKLLAGHWTTGAPPLGYLMKDGRVIVDPARGRFLRQAFELWNQGTMTAQEVADQLYQEGLVGRSGNQVPGKHLCELLKNSFYCGVMCVDGKEYSGVHPPLITKELFERAQEVFFQKKGRGRKPRRHLSFIMAKKLRCPWCASTLHTDHHQKKSGRLYRYYRCQPPRCTYSVRAEAVEEEVCENLGALRLFKLLAPLLKKKVVQAKKCRASGQADRIRHLRQERHRIEVELQRLAQTYGNGRMILESYEEQRELLQESLRATEYLLSTVEDGRENSQSDTLLLEQLTSLNQVLQADDPVAKRKIIELIVEKVDLTCQVPIITLTATIQGLLAEVNSRTQVRIPERSTIPANRTVLKHQKTAQ